MVIIGYNCCDYHCYYCYHHPSSSRSLSFYDCVGLLQARFYFLAVTRNSHSGDIWQPSQPNLGDAWQPLQPHPQPVFSSSTTFVHIFENRQPSAFCFEPSPTPASYPTTLDPREQTVVYSYGPREQTVVYSYGPREQTVVAYIVMALESKQVWPI